MQCVCPQMYMYDVAYSLLPTLLNKCCVNLKCHVGTLHSQPNLERLHSATVPGVTVSQQTIGLNLDHLRTCSKTKLHLSLHVGGGGGGG